MIGGVVNDGIWHHVAFTVDATGGRLYLDGVLQTNASWVGIPAAVSNFFNVEVAYFTGGLASQYGGLLDEVTLWNVALTQSQIQSNMNRSLSGSESGLIMYFRCDESAGPTTFDSAPAGGANDGTLVSGGSFVPSGAPIFSPTAQTLAASDVGGTNATLHGLVNASGTNTMAWFEWGTTTNHGNATSPQLVGSGTTNVAITQLVTGLIAGGTYHYRAAASNAVEVVFGTNVAFVTPPFGEVGGGLPGLYRGSVSWGDYDNDGDLDLLATGIENGAPATRLYRYNGSGFEAVLTGLPGVTGDTRNGAAAWGDYNNDGVLDIALTGVTDLQEYSAVADVWQGNGLGGFTGITSGILPIVSGSVAWGDFDADGRLDLLMTGWAWGWGSGASTEIRRNVGSTFLSVNAGLDGNVNGSAQWGDYDNDGRLDVLAAGYADSYGGPTKLWRNQGADFVDSGLALPTLAEAAVAWSDYDNDGLLDFLLTGFDGTNVLSQLWHNTGSGFTNVPVPGLPGVYFGSVAWADFDNDGLSDFFITGATNVNVSSLPVGYISQLWRNTGAGFANTGVSFPGVFYSATAWGDFDSDGRVDLALIGATSLSNGLYVADPITRIWRNDVSTPNTVPSPPVALSASWNLGTMTFSWGDGSDAETSSDGLTYNFRMGTTPGGHDVFSPMSGADGTRRIPALGNRQHSQTWSSSSVPFNVPIYWSVQTIDAALAGSDFANEQNFRILVEPVIVSAAVTNLIQGDANGDGFVDESEYNVVLGNYLATSPWLLMTNVAGLGGTNVSFALSNSLAGAFTVEYTTNLADWHELGPAAPQYLFTDTNAPAVPQRSYRLRWP